MTGVTIEDSVDVTYLDAILFEGVYRYPGHRLPKPVPAAVLMDVPHAHLRQWCVSRAVYQIITEELVAWLRDRIRWKHAIEICAGHGTLGRALGIPSSDSYMQTRPDMLAYYKSVQQLGMLPGDTLDDLFPGTGIVGRAWREVCR